MNMYLLRLIKRCLRQAGPSYASEYRLPVRFQLGHLVRSGRERDGEQVGSAGVRVGPINVLGSVVQFDDLFGVQLLVRVSFHVIVGIPQSIFSQEESPYDHPFEYETLPVHVDSVWPRTETDNVRHTTVGYRRSVWQRLV